MGMTPRKKPMHREVTLTVRPIVGGPVWWPKDAESGKPAVVSIDPYDPPGWSLGVDSDCSFDSIELWDQTGATIEEHVEAMKAEWIEEFSPDDDSDEIVEWEFSLV